MKNEDPKPINEALKRFAGCSSGLSEGLTARRIADLWRAMYAPQAAIHTKKVLFSAGMLTIQVDSDAWKNELMLRRTEIMERLNAALGHKTVNTVFFV